MSKVSQALHTMLACARAGWCQGKRLDLRCSVCAKSGLSLTAEYRMRKSQPSLENQLFLLRSPQETLCPSCIFSLLFLQRVNNLPLKNKKIPRLNLSCVRGSREYRAGFTRKNPFPLDETSFLHRTSVHAAYYVLCARTRGAAGGAQSRGCLFADLNSFICTVPD